MFVSKHSLRRLPAPALLLGAGLLVAGCCTCGRIISSSAPEPVNVLVTWKKATKTLTVSPEVAPLREGRQFVHWVLLDAPDGATITVRFKPGESPLLPRSGSEGKASAATEKGAPRQETFGPGQDISSGVPAPGTAGRRAKYSVTIQGAGAEPVTIDPWVEIGR